MVGTINVGVRVEAIEEAVGWASEHLAQAYPQEWVSVAADVFEQRLVTLQGQVTLLGEQVGSARSAVYAFAAEVAESS